MTNSSSSKIFVPTAYNNNIVLCETKHWNVIFSRKFDVLNCAHKSIGTLGVHVCVSSSNYCNSFYPVTSFVYRFIFLPSYNIQIMMHVGTYFYYTIMLLSLFPFRWICGKKNYSLLIYHHDAINMKSFTVIIIKLTVIDVV